MGCCNRFSRWLIAIVSICVIICCVVGSVLVYKKEKDKDWSKLIKNNIPFIFILAVMAFAVISCIIGFLLCCCEKKCLFVTYLVIIILVICVEIAAIVLAFCYKDNIIDGIEENWNNTKLNETIIEIEKSYECCGFKTPDPDGQCGYIPPEGEVAMLCYNKIDNEIKENMKNLQIVAIIMAIVEVILLICACYLVCCDRARVSN